jgi:hypothetical protein
MSKNNIEYERSEKCKEVRRRYKERTKQKAAARQTYLRSIGKGYDNKYYEKHKNDPEFIARCRLKEKKFRDSPYGKNKRIEQRLISEYGITLVQKEQMLVSQDSCCAICGEKIANISKAHVDHNHINNKIRALLCVRCNLLLGYAKENILTLEKAIIYLRKWNI